MIELEILCRLPIGSHEENGSSPYFNTFLELLETGLVLFLKGGLKEDSLVAIDSLEDLLVLPVHFPEELLESLEGVEVDNDAIGDKLG